MTTPGWASVKAILADALDRQPASRAAFVEAACAGDLALRRRVEALLAMEADATSFLASPAVALGSDEPSDDPGLAARIEKMEGQIDTDARYVVEEEVGRGGMGSVYRVFDTDLRRRLAMKVAAADDTRAALGRRADADTLARLLEEAQVTAQLDHPGVVPIHELGVDARGRLYFTMRLVRGRTLSEVFESVNEQGAGWNLPRALGVLLKVCETLSFAHERGVVHRDLKPANILVGDHGEVYVIDWGLARVEGMPDRRDLRLAPLADRPVTVIETDRRDSRESDSDSPLVTMDGAVVGTPFFMPPEQAAGEVERIDARSDVYAVGAMLYHLLTGRMPYHAPGQRASPHTVLAMVLQGPPRPVHELTKRVPAELGAICDKAMAREPERRYPDVRGLAEDLRAFLEDRVVRAHRTGALAALRKWTRRNRGLAGTVAAAAALLILGAGLYLAGLERAQRETRARGLASAAVEALELDPLLSLLLARRATETDGTPETFSALHRAVNASRARRVLRYPAEVLDVDVSPTGDAILAGSRLTWLSDGVSVVLSGHAGEVRASRFSPSGGLLLTASADHTARLWDLDGRELAVLQHDGPLRDASFSPDGRYVLTASEDGTARLWSAEGAPYAELRGHQGWVMGAAFSASGRYVVTASADATARVWELREEADDVVELAVLEGHEGPLCTARFSPAEDRIVTASGRGYVGAKPPGQDRTARIWSLDGEQLAVCSGHTNAVEWAEFFPDGDRILSVSADGTARVWDLEGNPLAVHRTPTGSPLWGAAFAPSGDTFAVSDARGWVWIFHVSGRLIGRLAGQTGDVRVPRYARDGSRIATGSRDQTVRLWSPTDQELPEYVGHGAAVHYAEYSSDGAHVITASGDGTARVWSRDGTTTAILPHADAVMRATFSPQDDGLALTASRDATAQLWHLPDGGRGPTLRHDSEVRWAAFAPSGDRIVTFSYHSVIGWDLEGTELFRFPAEDFTGLVEFSPNEERLLVTSKGARLCSLDGTVLRQFAAGGGVTFSALSLQADRVLTGHGNGALRLWPITDEPGRNPVVEWSGHESAIGWGSFSPTQDLVVTSGRDRTARIWDLAGNLRSVLRGHEGVVPSAVFSPDGTRILTASWDGTARTWIVDRDELTALASERSLRGFHRMEQVRYADLLGSSGDGTQGR